MSRAFPGLDVIRDSIYRQPLSPGWMREEEVYQRHPAVTPEFVLVAYHAGRALVLRERPAEVVWVRPNDCDWERFARAARAGTVSQ